MNIPRASLGLGRPVVVSIHVGYRTIARDERVDVTESSTQLFEAADAGLVLAQHGPELQKSG